MQMNLRLNGGSVERLSKCHSYKTDIFCFLYFILEIEIMNIKKVEKNS